MKHIIRLLTFCLCLFNYLELLCMERELAAAVAQTAEDSKTAAHRWKEASCTVLNIERDLILDADFNADGDKVITALRNKSVVVWRVVDGTCLYTLVGHNGPVLSAQFNPQETVIVTASEDGTIKVWNTTNGACISTITIAGVRSAEFDRTGDAILVRCQSNAHIFSFPELRNILSVETPEVQFCSDDSIMALYRQEANLSRLET